jgi:signal transduction histidine kinase
VSALVNLLVNAIDAAGTTGKVITLRSGESDGGSFVEVEDDGSGMPLDVEKRVFEPFFTTKGTEGTGLGLAMVYATVLRYGGSITLDTALGRGTRFRLWFPAAAT